MDHPLDLEQMVRWMGYADKYLLRERRSNRTLYSRSGNLDGFVEKAGLYQGLVTKGAPAERVWN